MIFEGRKLLFAEHTRSRPSKIVIFFTFIYYNLIRRFYQKVKSDIFWQICYYAMNRLTCAKK